MEVSASRAGVDWMRSYVGIAGFLELAKVKYRRYGKLEILEALRLGIFAFCLGCFLSLPRR